MKRSLKIKRKTVISIISFTVVLIITCFFIFPILWQYIGAFKSGKEVVAMPPVYFFKPSFQSWIELQNTKQVLLHLRNSIVIVGIAILLNILLSVITGYSLARFSYKGRNKLGFIILTLTMIPSVSLLIPIYDIMIKINLIGTHLALILIYLVFSLPFSVWLMRGFFAEIPVEIEEAGLIDGCSRFGVLIRIVMPISKPGIFATVIFSLMMIWGDFVFAGIIGSKDSFTLPVIAAMTTGKFGSEWGQLAALTVVITLPMLLFAMLIQKHLVKALTMGAVKG